MEFRKKYDQLNAIIHNSGIDPQMQLSKTEASKVMKYGRIINLKSDFSYKLIFTL